MIPMQTTGTVYHLVLASRQPTVQAFTRWKEGSREAAREIQSEFAKTLGAPLAESIVGTMCCCEREAIPSVQIQIRDSFLHLPPKIAYLVKLAHLDREEKVLGQFEAYLREHPETALMILADIAMGKCRLETVPCFDQMTKLTYWMRRISMRGGAATLYSIDSVAYVCAEAQWFNKTVESLGIVHGRGRLSGGLLKEIFSSSDGMKPYKGFGGLYLSPNSNPLFAEAALPLGTEAEGSALRIFGNGSR